MRPLATFASAGEAAAFEASLPPGGYEIQVFLDEPLTGQEIVQLKEELAFNGVDVRQIHQSGNTLYVRYIRSETNGRIAFAIPAMIGLLAALGVGAWAIFKWEEITSGLAKLLLIGGGVVIIALALARKPAMQYIEKMPQR